MKQFITVYVNKFTNENTNAWLMTAILLVSHAEKHGRLNMYAVYIH